MSIDLIVELAWKSTACAALTLLILALIKGRSAAERSRVAHAGLLVVLMLPVTLLAMPALEVKAPATVVEAMPSLVSTAHAPAPAATPLAGEPAVPAEDPLIPVETMLPALLLLPAALLLLLTLYAVLRLQLLRSRSEVLVDSTWLTALASTQHRFGFKHGTALLVSRELSSPISWGVMRPVILLDENAAQDSREAEAIIAHELAHVARLDWAKLILGRAATALFWFNPLVWILASRCHELREEAADDAVLRTDFARADYAQLLVGVARHENRAMLLAANGVAPSKGSLSRRVMRVLDGSLSRVPARLGWTIACCGGAVLVNAPLAAITLVGPEQRTVVTADGSARVTRTRTADGSDKIVIVPSGGKRATSVIVRQDPAMVTPLAAAATATAAEAHPLAPTSRRGMASVESTLLGEAFVKAAEMGDRSTVDRLLDAGLSPNVAVPGDGTPLIAAARGGHRRLVEYLLSKGADINQPLSGDANPLIAAAAAGHLDIVRLLVERGADIEFIVPSDENALMQAAYWGHANVVGYLIGRGANVNSRDGSRTPLSMAREGGHPHIEKLLAEAGAIR